jgi:hypothetical protein
LDALQAAFGGAEVPKDYFLALFDDEGEGEAMYNMHADRVRCAGSGRRRGRG